MSRYQTYRKRNFSFRLIRTLVGIIASFLLLFSPNLASDKFTAFFVGSAFAAPAFGLGLFGAIVSYWKRRFGAAFMFVGALFGIGLIPLGSLAVIALIMFAFCIISAYWHAIPD
jgi:hypothetical protein